MNKMNKQTNEILQFIVCIIGIIISFLMNLQLIYIGIIIYIILKWIFPYFKRKLNKIKGWFYE